MFLRGNTMRKIFVSRTASALYIAACAVLCPAALWYGYVCLASFDLSQRRMIVTADGSFELSRDLVFSRSAVITLLGALLVLAVVIFAILGFWKRFATRFAGVGSLVTILYMISASTYTQLSEYTFMRNHFPWGLIIDTEAEWNKITSDMIYISLSIKYCLWGVAALLFILSAVTELYRVLSMKK